MNKLALALIVPIVGFLSFDAAAINYSPNYVWQRWVDWTPGSVPGSSLGSIDDDLAGSPVWRYGYLAGDSFGSSDPWYQKNLQAAVWDDVWWGSNVGGVWARTYAGPGADNVGANPPIDRYTMWHDLTSHTKSYQYTSAIDWMNPVGDGAILNMSGSFVFSWWGQFAQNSPSAPMEAVLAKYDASLGSYEILWSGSYTNPLEGSPLMSSVSVTAPLTLIGVRFDEGDYLRFTFRGQSGESSTPLWLGFRDGLYMRLVSVVPEPATFNQIVAGLMFVWGVGAAYRRARLPS